MAFQVLDNQIDRLHMKMQTPIVPFERKDWSPPRKILS